MKNSILRSLILFIGLIVNLSTQALDIPCTAVQIDCSLEPISRSSFNDNFSSRLHGSSLHNPVAEGLSLNWSGYAALTCLTDPTVGSVSNVWGYWTVPALTDIQENAYSAIWVGMDGYSNGTVEQIGTEQDWTINGQENYAWFEMYPAGAYQILGFPVDVNDQIGAEVKYQENDVFQLSIINYTKDVYFVVPLSYTIAPNAQRTSAEWIVEAPSSSLTDQILPLADFGTVLFHNCRATINGRNGPIDNTHWTYDALTMITSTSQIKSLPSELNNKGQNFTLTWEHQ